MQHFAQAAQSLAGAFFVLNEREAHMAVAVLAKADAGTYSNFCVPEQQFREFKRAHLLKLLGNLRPYKHSGARHLDGPSQTVEAVHQAIAAAAIGIADYCAASLLSVARRFMISASGTCD